MRLSLVLGAAAAALFFATPSQEAKANYCVNEDDVGMVCGFVTLQQCEETRAGLGGFCIRDQFARMIAQVRPAPAKKTGKPAR